MQDDPASELPRIPLKRTSENSYSETVWKIAEGVSSTLLWRQEAADRDFFDPSWPLRSPDSGSIPNFQTVSPRTPVNKGYASQRMMRGLFTSGRPFTLTVTRE